MIEAQLNAHLRSKVTLVANRVYPSVLPEGATLPALVYTRISGHRVHAHDGYTGLANPRFQVTAHANSFSEMMQVAAQVRDAILDWPEYPQALLDNEVPLYDNDLQKHYMVTDFTVWIHETTN
jgi:hypothetical protein